MFAVIRTGGKQYKVAENDVIAIEKIAGAAGEMIQLDEVLAVGDGKSQTIGAPLVAGASVAATVLDQNKADKIIIFKKKRRQGYRRKNGHRQLQTVLRITEILTDGKKPSAKAKVAIKAKAEAKPQADAKPKLEAEAEKPATKKPAAKKPAAEKKS